jgi:hypothetical protein
VTVTVNGCTSAAGTTSVNVTEISSFIYTSGATTFCAGGSVTLNSNFVSGNQWLLNGTPIPGATNKSYVATASGSYTHIATVNGCSSPQSNAIIVTVNPLPDATISTTPVLPAGSSSIASVAGAGGGATYAWTIANGTINSGNGTSSIGFTTGSAGPVTLNVTVTTSAGCHDAKSASMSIFPNITAFSPAFSRTTGGTNVSITGTGFQSGATVAFGGVAATNVVHAGTTSITATTAPHAAGPVGLTVANPDGVSMTVSGFTYLAQQFDPNNDHVIDPADVFYLVNYLFTGGPAPKGQAGMASGDANNDGVVDPADIFYLVNDLFTGGPAPMSIEPRSAAAPLTGAVTLGEPVVRGGRIFVPVIVESGASKPHALSLRVRAGGAATIAAVRRAGAAKELSPIFEISRPAAGGMAYLVSFGASAVSGIVAEIEVSAAPGVKAEIDLDPALTMLTDQSGNEKATVANGRLQLGGTTIGRGRVVPKLEN